MKKQNLIVGQDKDLSLEKSIIKLNQLAMQNLEQKKQNHVLFYLNQCLISSKQIQNQETNARLLALTYNNLACYFQSIKKSEKALDFLFKSVSLLSSFKDVTNLSAGHLNICSILSALGQHERALRHALKSVYLLRSHDRFSINLAKAYLAAGSEYKVLNQAKDAIDCFEKGYSLSKAKLGSQFSLTVALKCALDSVKKPLEQLKTTKISRNKSNLHKRAVSSFEERVVKQLRNRGKSTGGVGKIETKKKFNIDLQRLQEKKAAVLIQAWWRGVASRKRTDELRIEKEILKAEEKAKEALEEVSRLKEKMARRVEKKREKVDEGKVNKAVLVIQRWLRKMWNKRE